VVLQSLQRKINFVLFVVAFTVFLLIFLLTGVAEYWKLRVEYSATMRARINVAQALIKDVLFHTDAMVQPLLKKHSGQRDELLSQLAASRYFEFHGDSFYVLDSHGKVLLISEPYLEYKGLDFSAMISQKSGYRRKVDHHYQSLLSKKSVVTIQYPLDDGLLVVERSLEHFIPVMASFESGRLYEGEMFFVLSTTGRTIYHPDHSLMATRHNLGFDLKNRTLPERDGFFSFRYKGFTYVALSEQFTEPSDWTMYYSIPRSVMIQSIKSDMLNQLGFMLFFFLLLYLTLRVVFDRFVSRPVGNIVGALEQSRQGESLFLSSEMSGGILEFNTIMEAISTRDKVITSVAERFQAVLDSLDAIVYVADMETYELLFLNSYGRKIGGDCLGKKCYLTLQLGQNSPCSFCTNHLLVDSSGTPTGVHVGEFQNAITGQWFEYRDRAIYWTDGKLVRMQIAIDISARKMAEEALQAEKERLSVTLRSIGDGVITTDTEGKVVFLNKVAEDLSGWGNDDATGKPSGKVFNIINEKTGLRCASPVQRVMELGRTIGLANHTALIAKNGTVRSIADSGAPIRDKKSKIIGVVIVFRDITHEKRMEEELLRVRKLESIGVLAGGIAHDFNNILAAILGNIELVGYRVAEGDAKVASLLSNAQKATKRAVKLTKQLLTFSKGGDPVRETIFLPEVITDSADFVLRGSQVACKYIFPDDLWMVDVDSGQIGQVIQNIILNSRHALPEGGVVTVQCANIQDAAMETLLSVDDGNYVRITIQDTGVGIPKEIIDKIFDPYFTTKLEGNGLGLAICHSIINKHDGYLTVASIPGKGTTFTLYLPAAASTGGSIVKKQEKNRPVKAARVLVMDDIEMLRILTESQLAALGHESVLVADGEQAINKYQEFQDSGMPIDLVIMDLTIPGGMGGKEAAEKLLQIDPSAKIIVASGYSNDPVMCNFREHGFCAAVAKPFDLMELGKAIAAVLDR